LIINKNILIIGADSFVARHFIQKTRCPNRIKLISRKQIPGEQIIYCEDFANIEEKHFDWADVVMNFAAVVHSPKAEAESYYRVNHQLMQENASKARKNGVRLFIQMSSLSVYGPQPYIKASTPEKPLTHYGKSKLLADQTLQDMETKLFRILILRPPMIYGALDAPGNMNKLIRLVRKGWPLPFARTKNQKQFLNINNLIAILDELIEQEKTGIVIPADKDRISIGELTHTIAQKLDKSTRLFHIPTQNHILKILFPALYHKMFASSIIDPDFCYSLSQGTGIAKGIEEMTGST